MDNETKNRLRKLSQTLRVALTGKEIGPPLCDVIILLGRHEVLARIDDAISWIEKHENTKTIE